MAQTVCRKNALHRFVFLITACVFLVIGILNMYHVHMKPMDECVWVDSKEGVKIVSVQEGGAADQAGLRPGDILLQIAGESATTSSRAQTILDRQRVGTTVLYFIFRNGELVTLDVEMVQRGFTLSYLIMSSVGFVFWLVGLWIGLMRPQDVKARILFLLFLSFMLFWTLNITSPLSGAFLWVALILQAVVFATVPIFFLYFFLVYPTKHPVLEKKWVYPLLFSPLFLVLLSFAITLFFGYPSPINLPVGLGLWGVYFGLALKRLHHSYRSTKDVHLRQQIRVLFWGLAIGLIPAFVLIPLGLLGIGFPWSNYGGFCIGIIPFVFAYTVVRHRLMDIEFIIKKSFVYTVLTGLVVGFYLLVVQMVGNFLQGMGGLTGTFVLVFSTLLIAVVFAPVREKVQRIVDRAFYREAYDYRETLRQFARALNTLMEPETLMDTVLGKICETMHVREGYFFVGGTEQEAYSAVRAYPVATLEKPISVGSHTLLCQKMLRLKGPVFLSEVKDQGKEHEASMVGGVAVPLISNDNLLGFLFLGAKRSETPYTKEDVELLATVADHVAVALENGQLHQGLTEQERMKRELEIARQIQLNSLPQTDPALPGFDIFGYSFPAMEVGGDYYDYFPVSDDRLFIVVGDVSGKGTSAALYLSKIQGFIRALIPSLHSPRELLCRVNGLAFENTEEKSFATVVASVIDSDKKSMTVVRAGHTAVLCYSKHDGRCYHWAPSGIGLALDEGRLFEQALKEETKRLAPGDAFLLYSDGLIEATNHENEEFGEYRLETVFCQNIHLPAKPMGLAIVETVRGFIGNQLQHDDMTLVVIKVG